MPKYKFNTWHYKVLLVLYLSAFHHILTATNSRHCCRVWMSIHRKVVTILPFRVIAYDQVTVCLKCLFLISVFKYQLCEMNGRGKANYFTRLIREPFVMWLFLFFKSIVEIFKAKDFRNQGNVEFAKDEVCFSTHSAIFFKFYF